MQCIGHQQQFHQVVVGGRAGGLNDEHILPAHVLVQFNIDLAVAELVHFSTSERHSKPLGDLQRQIGVGIAGENHQIVWHIAT